MLLFIGATEVILILFAVLLLFGSKKIPEVARAMGKGIREFQKATEEIKKELSDVEKEKEKFEEESFTTSTPSNNKEESNE